MNNEQERWAHRLLEHISAYQKLPEIQEWQMWNLGESVLMIMIFNYPWAAYINKWSDLDLDWQTLMGIKRNMVIEYRDEEMNRLLNGDYSTLFKIKKILLAEIECKKKILQIKYSDVINDELKGLEISYNELITALSDYKILEETKDGK